jgi:sec-independent protein translocase protein TatA
MGLDNPLHIAFLLILLLLVFGAKRLPEMGRSLGSGMRGFKDTLSGEHTHEPHESVAAAIPAQAPATPAASTTVPAPQSEAAVVARSVGERVPVA